MARQAVMKVAVIGTGIAGNVAAWRLAREHDVTVFEADDRIGGHSHTVDVILGGQRHAVDTGFIVFNDRTYPQFTRILDELGVASQGSDMSFSVRHEGSGLEYNGSSLNTLFAQRSNLLRPSFHRMIHDILRFNREAPRLLEPGAPKMALGEYLEYGRYSTAFRDHYLLPMGAAIWSARPAEMARMPARFFVRFFDNHGMLTVNERPSWRVIRGGSRRYVEKLVARHRDRIRLRTPVESIRRLPRGVELRARGCAPEHYDHVFIATHGDQALAMLADPSDVEREVLGAFEYQPNEAVLHTDARLLPRRRRAWAAWNYHIPRQPQERVAVTYNMNILQSLDAAATLCVTLNHTAAIDPRQIICRMQSAHPVFTRGAVAAQQRHAEINGARRTWYCGAYWRYGFHEDGVVSALRAYDQFRIMIKNEQRNLRRTA